MDKNILKAYYQIKPLVPRRVQLAMRRALASMKLKTHANVWPIDERAAAPPAEWKGWPDGKRFAFLITHDIDTSKGQENCRPLVELERDMGFFGSYNFVPERYHVREDAEGLPYRQWIGSRGPRPESRWQVLQFSQDLPGAVTEDQPVHKGLGFSRFPVPLDVAQSGLDPRPGHQVRLLHVRHRSFRTAAGRRRDDLPFLGPLGNGDEGYVEIPYTLPQDFTLFVLLRQKNIDIWKRKLDWIVSKGGMALMLIHPDYINPGEGRKRVRGISSEVLFRFPSIRPEYLQGQYYHVLPRDLARFWKENYRISGCGT